jgi:chemotaxis protein CheC
MNVTSLQEDALRELINIGYGRAAAALSEMTQSRVMLEAPQLTLLEIAEVETALRRHFCDGLTCVNQAFSGPLTGNALLLLDQHSASTLANLVGRVDPSPAPPERRMSEVVVEIGNIVLNACLGVFGTLLRVQVMFTVPRLTVGSVGSLLRSLAVDAEPLSHALLVHTRFTIRSSNVRGYLGIVLGISSTATLLSAIDDWSGS